MIIHDKKLLKMAGTLCAQFRLKHEATISTALPVLAWEQCQRLQQQLQRAQQQGWQFAARRLQQDLNEALSRLQCEIQGLDRQLTPATQETHQATLHDIYADLLALREEFEAVSYEARERAIAVTTEPITLEGVYLGPFEIRLTWHENDHKPSFDYCVVALDPHPAATQDDVTHPHVQAETLCEGSGSQPLRQALQQGRLLEGFIIVANLLRTYNSDSPYVSLADWQGVDCSDCGYTIPDQEQWSCDDCDCTLCGDCTFHCPACHDHYCSGCVTHCAGCDEKYCLECVKSCAECQATRCPNCLPNQERCVECHDQKTQQTTTVAQGNDGTQCDTDLVVQPHSLGQAVVSP